MVVQSQQVSKTSSTMPTYTKQINLLEKKTLLCGYALTKNYPRTFRSETDSVFSVKFHW